MVAKRKRQKKPAAGPKRSKTARASMSTAVVKTGPFADSSDINRLVPCAGGHYAYVLHPGTGRTAHLPVDGSGFATLAAELVAGGFGARMRRDLEERIVQLPGLGWERLRPLFAEPVAPTA